MRPVTQGIVGLGLACTILLPIVAMAAADAGEFLPGGPTKPWLPDIHAETYRLSNGLTITLHQDHKSPLVSVHLTYNAGSKDDPPGRTGLAHLFEHLMFEGSQHSTSSFDSPIYQCLVNSTGSTGRDATFYQTTATSNALERVIWLEADRMGFLLPALTQAKLATARAVVANERRETIDDLPLGEVEESLCRTLYPAGHPYRNLIIGSLDDVAAARLEDVTRFCERYYSPSNAFLCIAGDFELIQAKVWIDKYFRPLPPGRLPAPVQRPVPILTEPRRFTLTDRVSHAYAGLVWPTVPANHPDEAALDVLADILGGDARWNRLFRALVYDRQIAIQTTAWHPTHRLAGSFEVTLITNADQRIDEMVQLADAEIERLKRDGPTSDEIRRVKIERRRARSMDLDSVTRKAQILNHYAGTHGNPLAYRSVLRKVFAVTPEDVRRVARAYLGSGRVEYRVYRGPRAPVPIDGNGVPLKPVQAVAVRSAQPEPPVVVPPAAAQDAFDRSIQPEIGQPVVPIPPLVERRRLSNGMELRIVERHDLPIVRLKLVVKSGETFAPRGKAGLSRLTVNLLQEGTKSRSAFQLETDLIAIGAALSTDGGMESSTLSLTTVTRHLERALDLYADVVLNPSFPDKEFLRLKLSGQAELRARTDNAEQIAEDVLPRLMYHPDHPYARATLGTLESAQSLTREDVVDFYHQNYVPRNVALVVVGDVRPDEIAAALESRFGRWPFGPIPPSPDLPPAPWPAGTPAIYLIDKPGTAQAVLSIGRVAASIRSPDRLGLAVLNEVLRGRINSNLRDEKGSTYGFSSNIDFRNDFGPFALTGAVPASQTGKTLFEIFKEMDHLAGGASVTDDEIAQIRRGRGPQWIERFETITGVAAEIADAVSHDLPANHFATEFAAIEEVTKSDVDWLATHFLSPRWMTVVIVGDRSRIEKSLRGFPLGKSLHFVDSRGKPVRGTGGKRVAPVAVAGRSSSP